MTPALPAADRRDQRYFVAIVKPAVRVGELGVYREARAVAEAAHLRVARTNRLTDLAGNRAVGKVER